MEHPEVTTDSRPVPTPVRGSQVDRPPQLDLDADSDVEVVSQVKCPDSWPHDCCPRSPWDRPSPASTALDGSEPKESGSGAEGGPKNSFPEGALTDVPKTNGVADFQGADDEDSDLNNQIPDINDKNAPRFAVGQHHLSENAIRLRSKRVFTKRVDGSMKVSESIFNEWKGGGRPKKTLEQIFKACGYDPEPCLRIQRESLFQLNQPP